MSSSLVVRGIAALTLLAAAPPHACETPQAACVAAAVGNRLMFAFPSPVQDTGYRWHRPETSTNHLEYEWQVQLGDCAAGERFESNGFAFGAQLFKQEGTRESTGTLSDVLEVAQRAVARRLESIEQVRYSVLPEFTVLAAERGGRVLVGASDAPTVTALTKTRPRYARLLHRTPENSNGEECITALKFDQ